VKGITVDRSSNRVGDAKPARPPKLATGIIGGMAECTPACAAGVAPALPNCIAAAAGLTDGAAPVQADGTDNAPTEVA
jgi:hypothetical protein